MTGNLGARSINSKSTTGRILPRVILALLACEILVPRISLGPAMFTLDDVIPLLVGALGMLELLRFGKVPKYSLIFLLLMWSILGSLATLQHISSSQGFWGSLAKGAIRPFNSFLLRS